MGNYKIVASDLDGTLLNSAGEVSAENCRAIEEMTARGVQFVPCTGRTLHELDPKIRDNPAVRYIIHSDGAVIYDKQTDSRIAACMPQKTVQRMLDILDSYETLPAVRYDRNVYMNAAQMKEEIFDHFHVEPYGRNHVFPWSIKRDDFDAFFRSLDEIEMVGTYFTSTEALDECIARLHATGEFLTVRWEGLDYCEIIYRDAGKGNALMRLADTLGYDRSQTIGVGDSTNDMTLIRSAGLGLAVENACELLKQEADATICHHQDHAIKYILEHYL